MLISFNHYYVNNCTNTLCSVDVSVSFNSNINGPSINIFDKTSILVFTIAVDCVMMSGNIKKITSWQGSRNSDNMNILSFFFIFLLSLIL